LLKRNKRNKRYKRNRNKRNRRNRKKKESISITLNIRQVVGGSGYGSAIAMIIAENRARGWNEWN
jgi:hypothetical protein